MRNWRTTVAAVGTALLNSWVNGGFDYDWRANLVSAGIVVWGVLQQDATFDRAE